MKKLKEINPHLDELILKDKLKGIPDSEIGKKYGVSFKYIEKLITQHNGVALSKLVSKKKIKNFAPKDFKEESTTVWSFKQRGNWATHSGEYRGNWSPYIPRNVILKYSEPHDLVLDCFCGAGTTLIECKLLGRRSIGVDINEKAIELSKKNLNFEPPYPLFTTYEPQLIVGDARDLSFIKDESVDLICTHPPYADIIHYTNNKKGDLSFLNTEQFLEEMKKVARENFRVLKPNKICAILIGDLRKNKYIIPLGFKLIDVYLKAGFRLKELVIKRQHNCKTTGFWYKNSIKHNFLLLAHEYLLIFEKPKVVSDYLIKKKKETNDLFVWKEVSLKEKKFNKYETTTVWIFQKENFDTQLFSNLVRRYGQDKNFAVLDILKENKKLSEISKEISLLFIKSSLLEKVSCPDEVNRYLATMRDLLLKNVDVIKPSGFVVIQTRDVRIDEYVEPLAKRVVNIFEGIDKLKLKEIVIISSDYKEDVYPEDNSQKFLKIVHQYLLIYERI